MRWLLIVIAAMLLAGCTETRTESASVERTRGIQAGQPTDLTTIRQERATAATDINVDLGPMVQAAVSAALGDVKGAVAGLAGQVQTLASKPIPAPPTAQELKALLAEAGQDAGMDPQTAGAIGGAGGLALLAFREWMAHRRTQRDADEAWEDIRQRGRTRVEGGPPA